LIDCNDIITYTGILLNLRQ